MSGPPKDIPASKLWSKLQEMPRPSKVVDFPRKGPDGEPLGQIRIWVLTQEEQMICATEAEKFARERLKDGKKDELGYESLYSNELCVQILYRACRDEEDINRTAFPTPKLLRAQFTTDECVVLFEHYLTVQMELGPVTSAVSQEELEAWITRIGEGGSAFPLSLLSSDLQKILVLTMASRLHNSGKATSSAGSQPLEPSPSSPPDDDETEGDTQ